ncbi:hypothetical protein FS749_010298 [Ceratobasidium sp. UAMH 11750]|nr:hypothetical protein FS749_010298 [Ceratobasidium sp. UAMH 11750]
MAHCYPLLQIDDIVALLNPHLPHALTVSGSLSTLGEVTEIYTSFAPAQTLQLIQGQTDGAQPFFIVLTHTTGGKDSSDQGRIYCSSERTEGNASPKDSELMYAFVKSYMSQLPAGTSRRIGAVHARWVDILRPNASYVSKGPVAQWVLAPPSPGTQAPPTAVPAGYYIDRLTPADLPRIVETSKAPRTNAYTLSRLPYSICIRATGTDVPVAWGFLHADCSIGILFVEREHRGRRLARAVVEHLPMYCGRDTTGGWKFSHVVAGNVEGSGLFGALPGWMCAWDTFWMTFTPIEEWKN